MASGELAFGDNVKVLASPDTEERGIAGASGVVVGTRIARASSEVIGGGTLETAVLVSLFDPENTALIARRLLEPLGTSSDFDVLDGLEEASAPYGHLFSTSEMRVRSTPETEELGLSGLVGVLTGETIPSSSDVSEVVGGSSVDYAISLWFEERQAELWFHPEVLEPASNDD